MPGIPAAIMAIEKRGWVISNRGAIIIIRIKRTNRSEIIANIRIIHTDNPVQVLKIETVIPAVTNSRTTTGKMGGAIGGIPVINHEMVGESTAKRITNRQVRNILPTITGINIGRKAGPKPRK